ncbi:UDP-glucose dehydrogenase family protein [Candidatus Nitrotoga sp. M5]|uniref:UDP-glucose dehydrogenase family protein n=1 Tax=Candidatus Nitrotoga sp. M5 TaxID=2890409 RepID=UPI001EF59C49|nr:UDP-glucose/GDP-mannose dehydrogenase family protein [Candidatus Nitrotoga sp. M5]CAH1387627.1 UDP-glucose 6-dehydrogenase [Candidatus Nitrotoga sp. M5]
MKVTIVGTGYVGLVGGACLAEVGNHVLCLDFDPAKICILENGDIPIHEPGLIDIVRRNVAAGRLGFTTDIDRAVAHARIQFIAVGTPPDEDGSADLQYVLAAAINIGSRMNEDKILAIKSTVPVGTAQKVNAVISAELQKRDMKLSYSVVANPEFLKEGAAIEDFLRPDRIVIGSDDAHAIQQMQELYAPFNLSRDRIIVMDVKSAELTKYAANAMLATRISFMNELANLAEQFGADIEMVRLGIGSDTRIGKHFLYSGCGYGGSCFPKDVKALIKIANDDAGITLKILNAVEAVNDAQKKILTNKIKAKFGTDLIGKNFAIWGLAFKPNTDDMRDAPSRKLISDLLEAGATVTAYDPAAMPESQRIFGNNPGISYAENPLAACKDADALVIVTEWKEFRNPDFAIIKAMLKYPLIFDGRSMYESAELSAHGLEYYPIGR